MPIVSHRFVFAAARVVSACARCRPAVFSCLRVVFHRLRVVFRRLPSFLKKPLRPPYSLFAIHSVFPVQLSPKNALIGGCSA